MEGRSKKASIKRLNLRRSDGEYLGKGDYRLNYPKRLR